MSAQWCLQGSLLSADVTNVTLRVTLRKTAAHLFASACSLEAASVAAADGRPGQHHWPLDLNLSAASQRAEKVVDSTA